MLVGIIENFTMSFTGFFNIWEIRASGLKLQKVFFEKRDMNATSYIIKQNVLNMCEFVNTFAS